MINPELISLPPGVYRCLRFSLFISILTPGGGMTGRSFRIGTAIEVKWSELANPFCNRERPLFRGHPKLKPLPLDVQLLVHN